MKDALTIILAILVLLPWGTAFAGSKDITTSPSGEKRIALVVGNATYQHATPLRNPINDAKLMANTLKSVGFQIVGGKPLIDADKQAFERAIRDFGQALRGGSVGLFYYSGHGVQVKGANYLIPVSANINGEADVKYELVDASFVIDEMANAGNRLNVVILDACRNNPFGGRGLRNTGSGLAQVTAPKGTVISYATQPGNTASDGSGKNSPYTEALATAVSTPGLGVFDTFNAVGLKVANATSGQQQPWLATSPIEGQFYFSGSQASNQAHSPAVLPAQVSAMEAVDKDMVARTTVRVRESPNAQSKVVTTLTEGDAVVIPERVRGDNWGVVEYKGKRLGFAVLDGFEEATSWKKRKELEANSQQKTDDGPSRPLHPEEAAKPSPTLSLRSISGKQSFSNGEIVRLRAISNQEGHLYCFLSSQGSSLTKIFPNRYKMNNIISPSQSVDIPGDGRIEVTAERNATTETVDCFQSDANVTHLLPDELQQAVLRPVPGLSFETLVNNIKVRSAAKIVTARYLIIAR
ncbi:MAG: caspase family protein [Alphaproteobacteria bacterium]|nr:caspase family protein [Alphaproteobacteria bacterium]